MVVYWHNDVLAVGAMHVTRAAAFPIAAEISVEAYDDIASSVHLAPPLTTTRFSSKEMGRQVATMLFQAIEQVEGFEPHTVEIPVKLVTRESTGPPPQIK